MLLFLLRCPQLLLAQLLQLVLVDDLPQLLLTELLDPVVLQPSCRLDPLLTHRDDVRTQVDLRFQLDPALLV